MKGKTIIILLVVMFAFSINLAYANIIDDAKDKVTKLWDVVINSVNDPVKLGAASENFISAVTELKETMRIAAGESDKWRNEFKVFMKTLPEVTDKIDPLALKEMFRTTMELKDYNITLQKQNEALLAQIDEFKSGKVPFIITKSLISISASAKPGDKTYCKLKVYLDNPPDTKGHPSISDKSPVAECDHSEFTGIIPNSILSEGSHSIHVYAMFPGDNPAEAWVNVSYPNGVWKWKVINSTGSIIKAGMGSGFLYHTKFDFDVLKIGSVQTITPSTLKD